MSHSSLFANLYNAKNEDAITQIIQNSSRLSDPSNWYPLDGNESNFGVVENQQSNPVAALVEKITNSIDAILMRKCFEAGIDPKSADAPRSIEDAIERFFPDHRNWDLTEPRNEQARALQLLADSEPGDTANTSLIIYDNGEGQHPEDFEDTFLSLLRGNKNEVHFVQGKYNMGGTGALVFCGKQRYQLIASKKYDGSGWFGFTLVRKHPLTAQEKQTKKNTWYEYFKLDEEIPAFEIDELDLRLHETRFRTGTIIKLYSYDTKGNRHLRRDMSRSLQEFLYEPALPFYVVERPERYPNDNVLTGVVYGLKRQLDPTQNDYIEEMFSEVINDKHMGQVRVTVHVFAIRAKGKKPKATKEYIRREYFKNNMSVLFSMNGQVHGHYTTEFITRTLKFNLLRDYLLIHVDCTGMQIDFRNELFMASRDRLKQGEEATYLRKKLGDSLKSGQLKEVYKRRKDNISVESADDDSLLKNFAEKLPINNELRGLLNQTFKLDAEDKPKPKRKTPSKDNGTAEEFNPQRYPSFFNVKVKEKNGRTVVSVPLNGTKTVEFDSDVESQFFDRIEEPGDMKIAIMTYTPNDVTGGTEKGTVNDISDVLTVSRRSPQKGKIKVVFNPTKEVQVGDEMQIRVDLESPAHPDGTFQHILWVKVTEPKSENPQKVPMQDEAEKLGLPNYVLVYERKPNEDSEVKTWADIEDAAGIEMSYDDVMHPVLEGDTLETIYINMDCSVLKNYKSKQKRISPEQVQLADRRYITSVYFHTLFLYVINKQKQYHVYQVHGEDEKNIELDEYLRSLFESHYAEFLLNFGTSELMEGLG